MCPSSTKASPCQTVTGFGEVQTRGDTLVRVVMKQRSTNWPQFKYTVPNDTDPTGSQCIELTSQMVGMYDLGSLRRYPGLHDLMNMTEYNPRGRDGFAWEASQVLALDYCNRHPQVCFDMALQFNSASQDAAWDYHIAASYPNASVHSGGAVAGGSKALGRRLTGSIMTDIEAPAVVKAILLALGSAESYPSQYDPALQRFGYTISRRRLNFCGIACLESVTNLTFLVVPRFVNNVFSGKCTASLSVTYVDLELDYYMTVVNGSKVVNASGAPMYFMTAQYVLSIADRLSNPSVVDTGMLYCSMKAWYFTSPIEDSLQGKPYLVPADQLSPPFQVASSLYVCTLYNNWVKVLSLSIPFGAGAYMVMGWIVTAGVALREALRAHKKDNQDNRDNRNDVSGLP